jgi:hypothetical protein
LGRGAERGTGGEEGVGSRGKNHAARFGSMERGALNRAGYELGLAGKPGTANLPIGLLEPGGF